MSWGVPKRLKRVLGLINEPMEYEGEGQRGVFSIQSKEEYIDRELNKFFDSQKRPSVTSRSSETPGASFYQREKEANDKLRGSIQGAQTDVPQIDRRQLVKDANNRYTRGD